jgi:hypothetical protein
MKTPQHPAFVAKARSSSSSVLGTSDVFRAGADEVVVHHQNTFLTDRLEFTHDIRNWAPAQPPDKFS